MTAIPAPHARSARHVAETHRSVGGGAARAAVFGVSDGLVTNLSLIVGTAGAHPAASVVQLAGLGGLVAGACSMALGEYVSMQAQRELLLRELDVERNEIRRFPEAEHHELSTIYQRRGLPKDMANAVATTLMRDEDTALRTHAREELGIDPGDLGAPLAAAAASFASFALGAAVPLVPWLVGRGAVAVATSLVAAAVSASVVGGLLGRFTGRSWRRSAARQLALSAAACAVTFTIGLVAGHAGLR